jgi:hypothetical protein
MIVRIGIPLCAAALLGSFPAAVQAQQATLSFFVTSVGKGNGADLGGIEGADAHCQALARAAGSTNANWRAYLSTTQPGGEAGVSARDRIGKGPWQNAKGVVVAKSIEDLHSDAAGGDTTCGNWSKSGEGSAIVGHHDRTGLKDTWHMRSWNSSHGSRGCSQDALKSSGGAGCSTASPPTEAAVLS